MDTLKLSWLSAPVAILLGAVMIAGSVLYIGGAGRGASIGPAATPTPLVVDLQTLLGPDDASLGNLKAQVTIVEFSDFQCPYCRQFFVDTFSALKKQYIDTGKVRLVYRHFPLIQIHPSAKPAALAAACAKDQSKFWEYHDTIFGEQQKHEPNPAVVSKTITFTTADLKSWARQSGLDMTQFNECFDSAKHAADVDADLQAGTDAGVTGTPSFFINGQLFVGAQPLAKFQTLIDRELAK